MYLPKSDYYLTSHRRNDNSSSAEVLFNNGKIRLTNGNCRQQREALKMFSRMDAKQMTNNASFSQSAIINCSIPQQIGKSIMVTLIKANFCRAFFINESTRLRALRLLQLFICKNREFNGFIGNLRPYRRSKTKLATVFALMRFKISIANRDLLV